MHEGLYDYENLWRLDVLGATSIAHDDIAVQQDFKNQLGWCWKTVLLHCKNIKLGSSGKLKNLLRNSQTHQ